jgi:hypothetical protein
MLRSTLAALVGGTLLCAPAALADVLTVAVDGSGDYSRIQDAIDASADGDTILIGPGSYNERLDPSGKNLTLRGINGYPQTIVDPGGGAGTLLTVGNGETDLTIEGLSFRNGQNTPMTVLNAKTSTSFISCRWLGGTAAEGAAMKINGAAASFTNCQWVSNISTSLGGAIHASNADLDFVGGKFVTNQCSGTRGGAIWISDSTLDLDGTEFSSNQCNTGSESFGGAIYMTGTGGAWNDCLFRGNVASCLNDINAGKTARAGDVYMSGSSPLVTGTIFEESLADSYEDNLDGQTVSAQGGSLFLESGASPNFFECNWTGARSRSWCREAGYHLGRCSPVSQNAFSLATGGCVHVSASCAPRFSGCHLFGSMASAYGEGVTGATSCSAAYGRVSTIARGGGIWMAVDAGAVLSHCDLVSCEAVRQSVSNTHGENLAKGGALYLENLASPSIQTCTFTDCESEYGGGIYATEQSSPFVSNSVFSGNTATARAGAVYSYNSAPSFSGTLFQSNTSPAGGAFYIEGVDGYFPQVGSSTFCGNAPEAFVGQYIDDEGNAFLTECGDDCNGNGISDAYEIENGGEADCNDNGALDSCEIAAKPGLDCDGDGTLDVCQAAGGGDCDGDGILDDCETDCDADGTPDDCQILKGSGTDCDGNGVLDACQIAADPSIDCNGNGLPDACDADCDADGTPDECQIAGDPSIDCNADDIPDVCQIASGDVNNDGVLDDCQVLDFAGIQIEIAPIAGVIRGDGTLMPRSAVCYRIYATFDDPGAHLIGLYGSSDDGSMIFTTDGGLYQDPEGGDTAADRPCDPAGLFPELAFDSFLTVGGDCASTSFEENVGVDFGAFNTTGSMVEPDGIILINPDDAQGHPDADGRVLVAQLTSLDGSAPDGRFNLIGTNADGSDFQAFQVTWGEPSLVDCNANGVQDAFDIGSGASLDCNLDGIPDECQTDDPYRDCNDNGTPDWCDISSGTSADVNANGVPDECECEGDLNGDGLVDVDDIILIILNWGEIGENPADADNNGIVNGKDLGLVITAFGGCF